MDPHSERRSSSGGRARSMWRCGAALALVAVAVGIAGGRSGRAQIPLTTFTTLNPQANGGFGSSVAARDLTGDGKAEIIVGAFYETVGGNAAQGRAYVFSGATGLLMNTFTTPNPQAGANFGSALALGDMDGDTKIDLAISAPGEDVSPNAGQG